MYIFYEWHILTKYASDSTGKLLRHISTVPCACSALADPGSRLPSCCYPSYWSGLEILHESNIWKLDLVKCVSFFHVCHFVHLSTADCTGKWLSVSMPAILNTVLPYSPSYTQWVSMQIVDGLCWVTLQRLLSKNARQAAGCLQSQFSVSFDHHLTSGGGLEIGVLALGVGLGWIWLQGMRRVCGC